MNLRHVASIRSRQAGGTWFRAVPPQFFATPLNTQFTRTIPSRFGAGSPTYPGFEILYLAQTQIVAMFEVNAMLGSLNGAYVPNPLAAHSYLPITVNLQSVVCLTDQGDED